MKRKHIALAALVCVGALSWPQLSVHRKAYRLLTALEPSAPEPAVTRTDESLPEVRGHWYFPAHTATQASALDGSLPALVFVHGLQREGIDSTRLIRFARAFADQGFAVYTPQIDELADYHLEASSVTTIANAVQYASRVAKRDKVGLFGVSFGGGLALMASAQEKDHVSFVGTLGGYGDANRVARFLLNGCAEEVGGGCKPQTPHDYGIVIFFYDYVDEFFSPSDAPVAKAALRLWLHERFDEAKTEAGKLSDEGKRKMEIIFTKQTAALKPEVMQSIVRHQSALDAISASKHALNITSPVFLLHAEGDPVVPDTEVAFLSAQLPNVGAQLVSPALGHAELGHATWQNKAALLHFIAQLLRAADP